MEWSQKKDDVFYLYGGEKDGGVNLLRDLWKYDISKNKWTELPTPGNVTPDAANYGAFAVTKGDDIFMAFGETNNRDTECTTNSIINSGHSLSDKTFEYDNGKWKELSFSTFSPQLKRPAYTYNRRRKNIYVYGGVDIVCQKNPDGTQVGPAVDVYNRQMYLFDV